MRVERAVETSADNRSVAPRRVAADYASIGADYFRSLGLRVPRGREFTAEEAEGREPRRVAIIDEPAVGRLFPSRSENPLGQLVRVVGSNASGQGLELFEIVGIVPGLRQSLLDPDPTPHLHVPFSHRARGGAPPAGGAALAASYIPARRAARVAVVSALRRE